MKNFSAMTWVAIIFASTLLLELVNLVVMGFSGMLVFRVVCSAILVAMLLRGSRIARYVLVALNGIGGLFGGGLALGLATHGKWPQALMFLAMCAFYCASATFFLRSRVLRSLTGSREEKAAG